MCSASHDGTRLVGVDRVLVAGPYAHRRRRSSRRWRRRARFRRRFARRAPTADDASASAGLLVQVFAPDISAGNDRDRRGPDDDRTRRLRRLRRRRREIDGRERTSTAVRTSARDPAAAGEL